jgi:hypothetical protein
LFKFHCKEWDKSNWHQLREPGQTLDSKSDQVSLQRLQNFTWWQDFWKSSEKASGLIGLHCTQMETPG